jgi:beta-lactamase class A
MAIHQDIWKPVVAIIHEVERRGAVLGVALQAQDGKHFSHRGTRRFVAASTVKLPIMVEVYRQIGEGTLHLNDVFVLSEGNKATQRNLSGVLANLHSGLTLTTRDLVFLMVSISDATATNILIERLGMSRVNQCMREMGMYGSTLERIMLGRVSRAGEPENWATPDDYARLVHNIISGGAGSPDATLEMIFMLEKQQNRRRLGRHIPNEPGVRWGSKTGGLAGVTNDVGFVMSPMGTVVLSVFCESQMDDYEAERSIGAIAIAACECTGVLRRTRH